MDTNDHLIELPAIELEGFEPSYGTIEYRWGPAVQHNGEPWQDHQYYAEILAWFDHDYLGQHAYMQVWDYGQQSRPGQRWQFMLALLRPTRHVNAEGLIVGSAWDWCIRVEYEGRADHRGPSYTQVGADVDLWVETPEVLRFLVE